VSFSFNVSKRNIHLISTMFEMLRDEGGLGVSFPSVSKYHRDGFIYTVAGFDRDGDLVFIDGYDKQAISRDVLHLSTLHTEVNPDRLFMMAAQSVMNRFNGFKQSADKSKQLREGQPVRYIKETEGSRDPNFPLFIVSISHAAPIDRNVMLAAMMPDGSVQTFVESLIRLELVEI